MKLRIRDHQGEQTVTDVVRFYEMIDGETIVVKRREGRDLRFFKAKVVLGEED